MWHDLSHLVEIRRSPRICFKMPSVLACFLLMAAGCEPAAQENAAPATSQEKQTLAPGSADAAAPEALLDAPARHQADASRPSAARSQSSSAVVPGKPGNATQPRKPPRVLAMPTAEQQTVPPDLAEEVQNKLVDKLTRNLPSGENARLDHHQKGYETWLQELCVASYRQVGHQDPKWDQQVEEFLQDYVAWGMRHGAKDTQQLATTGMELLRLGCQDPLVHSLYSLTRSQDGDSFDAVAACQAARTAIAGFQAHAYPPYLQCGVYERLAHCTEDREEEEESLDRAVQSLVAACKGSYPPDVQRYLAAEIWNDMEGLLSRRRAELIEALSADPDVDPWIAKILYGREQIRLAWKARGTGWGSTVTAEGWREFHIRLAAAKVQLLEAWRLHPEYPEAAAHLIAAVMGGGTAVGEDERFWFDEAVEAVFDYEEAYRSLSWAYRPRWGGNHQRMMNVARECLETGRYDTCVPWQFHVMAMYIATELDHAGDHFRQLLPEYRTLLEGYENAAQSDAKRKHFRSMLAAVSWMGGDQETARRLADELATDLSSEAMKQLGQSIGGFRRGVYPELFDKPPGPAPSFASHAGGLYSIAVTADGRELLTAGKDGTIRRWNAETGESTGELIGHRGEVTVLAVRHGDGLLAASDTEGEIRLWNLAQPQTVRVLQHGGPVTVLAWSADGKQLASASSQLLESGEIKLWHGDTGELTDTVSSEGQTVLSLAFTPDGGSLAVARQPNGFQAMRDTGELALWDLKSRTWTGRSTPNKGSVQRLVYSPDGRTLAMAGPHRQLHNRRPAVFRPLVVVENPGGTERHRIPTYNRPIWDVKFLNDHLAATGAEDGRVCIWDCAQGEFVSEFLSHRKMVVSFAVHPQGSWLYSADTDGHVLRWDVGAEIIRSRVHANIGQFTFAAGVKELRPLPTTGGLAVSGYHLGVTLWRADDNYQQALVFPRALVRVLVDSDVSADLRRVAFVEREVDNSAMELYVYDVKSGRRLPVPPAQRMQGLPSAVRYSPDGRVMVSGNAFGFVLLRDPDTMEVFSWGAVREHRRRVGRTAFSANGQVLATSSVDGQVKIWRMPADFQKQKQPLKSQRTLQFSESIQSISLSPEGGIVFVGFDETEVWDLDTGERLYVVPGQEVACSPDGTQFVTGGGKLGIESVIWDVESGQERVRLYGVHRSNIMTVTFTAEGRHVVSGDYSGKLCCWDASTGYEVLDFRIVHDTK